jgi:hypothetical protein
MRNATISLLTYFIITSSVYAPVNATVSKSEKRLREIPLKLKSKPIKISTQPIKKSKVMVKTYDRNGFLNAIGHFESGNDYKKVNTLGYLGRYQFGKSTLKTIKVKATKEEFLNNPHLQETAMWRLLKHNQRRLKKYIELYDGKVYNGKVITESGILAAAHLAGQGNVKKFFKNGKNTKDAYGTSLSKYLYEFSGYELKLK